MNTTLAPLPASLKANPRLSQWLFTFFVLVGLTSVFGFWLLGLWFLVIVACSPSPAASAACPVPLPWLVRFTRPVVPPAIA